MSTHPNAILMLVLTPDNLARKTYRAILSETSSDKIYIDGEPYNHRVMENEYDENFQIRAPEGSIVLTGFLTYGYGEKQEWIKIEAQKQSLETWAKDVCERHACTYEIFVTANFW